MSKRRFSQRMGIRHVVVAIDGMVEEEKSSRESDDADHHDPYYSNEFNEEQFPRNRRDLATGFIENGVSLTDPGLSHPHRHNDEGRKSVTESRLNSDREFGATDSRFFSSWD